MDRKKFLISITTLIILVGVGFALSPFILSLNPPSHLPDYADPINITGLNDNSIKVVRLKESRKVDTGTGTRWESGDALVIVKTKHPDFYVYWVPTWESRYPMPMKFWGQHEGYCDEYGLKKANGELVITCLSTEAPEFLYKEWIWSVDGKALGKQNPNLVKVNFRVQNEDLYAFWANK